MPPADEWKGVHVDKEHTYEAPELRVLGSVHEVTAGLGATGADTTLPILNLTGRIVQL